MLLIFFFGMNVLLNGQPAIVGKTLKAEIGSSCEEVIGDNSCAGLTIYMELYFEKGQVSVIEETVDSCGESTSEMIDAFPWHWAKDKHWTIVLGDLERTKYTSIENVRLTMRDGALLGEKLNKNGTVSQEYHFRESAK